MPPANTDMDGNGWKRVPSFCNTIDINRYDVSSACKTCPHHFLAGADRHPSNHSFSICDPLWCSQTFSVTQHFSLWFLSAALQPWREHQMPQPFWSSGISTQGTHRCRPDPRNSGSADRWPHCQVSILYNGQNMAKLHRNHWTPNDSRCFSGLPYWISSSWWWWWSSSSSSSSSSTSSSSSSSPQCLNIANPRYPAKATNN